MSSTSENAHAGGMGIQRSADLPLFVTITRCDSTSFVEWRSKIMCFSAWKKCSPCVTECTVKLPDSTFQPLLMDTKFDALEELFIQIYGGGRHRSARCGKQCYVRETMNVEMIPHHIIPYSNTVGGQCSRQAYGQRPMTQL